MRHYGFGRGKWVFVDWMAIEPGYGVAWKGAITDGYCMPEGVRIAVHQPMLDFTPVIAATPGAAHEQTGIGFACFLHDPNYSDSGDDLRGDFRGAPFRCWYNAMSPSGNPRWPVVIRHGHAVSDDGIHWRKPALNIQEFAGSKDNNLIVGPQGYVFIDPTVPPGSDGRYKMVAPGGSHGLLGATSADGLTFKQLPQPILPKNNTDTDDVCWFNPRTGRYVVYLRQTDGVMQRRGINRSESADFTSFPPSEPVIEANPIDPPDWDYYCNGFMPWPGAEDAYVMQIAIFKHHIDVVDVHLALSRDEKL